MTLSLAHYLILGAILFAISIVGIFLNRKNIIILLMAIELMLLAEIIGLAIGVPLAIACAVRSGQESADGAIAPGAPLGVTPSHPSKPGAAT